MLIPQKRFFPSPAVFVGGGSAPPWSPADISAEYWLDPSDLSTMFEDISSGGTGTPSSVDGPVGSMLNKGSAGGWAICATNSWRPTLRQSGDYYWLEFENTAPAVDYLYWESASGQFSIGVALNITASLGQIVSIGGTSGGIGSAIGFDTSSGKWAIYENGVGYHYANTVLTLGNSYILVTDGPASGTFYINGVSDGTYSGTSGDGGRGTIGGGSGYGFTGKIFQLVGKSTAFGADRTAVETFLASKMN